MALIRSGATNASTMSAEPRHGHLSIRGLHISHCRARELMGSTSSMEPFFEILTSGPLTLYSPNLIMARTRWSVLEARRACASGSGFDFRAQFSTVRQLCDLG